MTAIVLPDIDKSTVEELKKRIPNLAEIDLSALKKLDLKGIDLKNIEMPKLATVGKSADETIDRLLGRKRAPVWPWVAMGIGVAAVIGGIAAYMTWWRRPAWESTSEPWTASEPVSTADTFTDEQTYDTTGSTGLTAAESSLGSTSYPVEEA